MTCCAVPAWPLLFVAAGTTQSPRIRAQARTIQNYRDQSECPDARRHDVPGCWWRQTRTAAQPHSRFHLSFLFIYFLPNTGLRRDV